MSRFGDLISGKSPAPAPTPEPVVEPVSAPKPEVKKQSDLETMDKKQLEAYGRTKGVELDRRHSKQSLIKELKEID